MVTIYSLDVLLFLFGTSLFFHVQFELLLPDLHIGFSRGRSDGVVFLSLSEFSTVYCDPQSQRLCHSQKSRNRCFSGALLLFWWSGGYWQFGLWSSAFSKTSLVKVKSLNRVQLFATLWAVICLVFQICWHIECSTFTASSFRMISNSLFHPLPSPCVCVLSWSDLVLSDSLRPHGL